MRAFLIISGSSPSKNGKLVSIISAFVSIESVGIADDVVEAVSIIQQRYPNILIFNNRMFEEKGHDYLASILEAKGSFLMLPDHRQFREKCLYLGIDFSVAEQKEWVLSEIGETLREYRHFAAQ